MLYPFLAVLFFSSLLLVSLLIVAIIFKFPVYIKNRNKFKIFYLIWFAPYLVFILFFTGTDDLSSYPPPQTSPYKLPWAAGVSRIVAQGNSSFTSHRDFHRYAWDFVMPNGTQVLAARDGRVSQVEVSFDGIGFNSNYIIIDHEDGDKSNYAHIRHEGALVKLGDFVKQGQPIARSGMVGQTIFPHVHFYVTNKESTSSKPISFSDVPGGVPFAGHIYTSENITTDPAR